MTEQLTLQQQRFCDEYLLSFNAYQAALKAGYKPNTARKSGLLNLPKVQEYLQAAMAKTKERIEVSHDMLLREFAKVAFATMEDFCDEKGMLLPFNQLETEDKAAISHYEVRGVTGKEAGTVSKIKLHNKLTALDKIARHTGFYLFGKVKKKSGSPGAKSPEAAAQAPVSLGERMKIVDDYFDAWHLAGETGAPLSSVPECEYIAVERPDDGEEVRDDKGNLIRTYDKSSDRWVIQGEKMEDVKGKMEDVGCGMEDVTGRMEDVEGKTEDVEESGPNDCTVYTCAEHDGLQDDEVDDLPPMTMADARRLVEQLENEKKNNHTISPQGLTPALAKGEGDQSVMDRKVLSFREDLGEAKNHTKSPRKGKKVRPLRNGMRLPPLERTKTQKLQPIKRSLLNPRKEKKPTMAEKMRQVKQEWGTKRKYRVVYK